MQYWYEHLRIRNGKTWVQQIPKKTMSFDDNEIALKKIMSFVDNEIALIRSKKQMFVYRDTKNARLTVQTVVHNVTADKLSGAEIVFTEDRLPSIHGLLKGWGGNPDAFPETKQACLFAADHDVHEGVCLEA